MFINQLRDLYRKGDMAGLEKSYKLGKWRLAAEEQKKIEAILPKRNVDPNIEKFVAENKGWDWTDK